MHTSPRTTIIRWSLTISMRSEPAVTSLEDEEKMQTTEKRISIITMMITTLSPAKLSMKCQNFFALPLAMPYRFLTASLNFSPRSS